MKGATTMGKTPKEIITSLMNVQGREFGYDEFILVLKHRLRRFYGRDEVMFYSEEQLAEILVQNSFLTTAK
jgi:hypothetical protein